MRVQRYGKSGEWPNFSGEKCKKCVIFLLFALLFGIFAVLLCVISCRGIVLSAVGYADNKVVVNVLTETEGSVGFIVRRGRGARAAVWQPLSVVNVVWHMRGSGLQTPREISVARPWRSIPYSPNKAAMAMFLSEFLTHALRHEPHGEGLMAWLEASLAWLDAADADYANFHAVLLLKLTRFLGFAPNVGGWHEGAFFDLQAAEFTAVQPLHPDYLEADEAALVPALLRLGYGLMRRVRLDGASRRRLLDVIVWFYRLHVPGFGELRSLDVLSDVVRR